MYNFRNINGKQCNNHYDKFTAHQNNRTTFKTRYYTCLVVFHIYTEKK